MSNVNNFLDTGSTVTCPATGMLVILLTLMRLRQARGAAKRHLNLVELAAQIMAARKGLPKLPGPPFPANGCHEAANMQASDVIVVGAGQHSGNGTCGKVYEGRGMGTPSDRWLTSHQDGHVINSLVQCRRDKPEGYGEEGQGCVYSASP